MYITYRFTTNTPSPFTNSLHCNYYQKLQGPNPTCNAVTQNFSVTFGNEFGCLPNLNYYDAFEIICQKVSGDTKPNPNNWKIINVTSQLPSGTINQTNLSATTFIITNTLYSTASTYNLGSYIDLTTVGATGNVLNFGDEYFFYGNIETEIQATIYEMRYLCNLSQNEFTYTSNPTWSAGTSSYVTEIGLYDSNRNLMAISKLQSPIQRQSIQQFLVKLDF